MDRERLVEELADAFGGTETALRAVSRQARDLTDSGRIEEDLEYKPTVEDVLSNLEDAPEEYSVIERWNWWIGSLELSYGDYQRFRVRSDIEDPAE
ncbi:hypothetical protein ACFQJ7_13305 [Halovenus rubra]|uniref:Halobacterial output domain-containing protein n=2 Tax=Halovenus rubra TaxID=869890 RepID=A0ABD5XAR3_9EURY